MVYDVVDEQIDATSKAFSASPSPAPGATITSSIRSRLKDYYSLASIFASIQEFQGSRPEKNGFGSPLTSRSSPPEIYKNYTDEQDKITYAKQTIRFRSKRSPGSNTSRET